MHEVVHMVDEVFAETCGQFLTVVRRCVKLDEALRQLCEG